MGFNGFVVGGVLAGTFSVALTFIGLWGPGFIHETLNSQIDETLVVTSNSSKGYADWLTEHTDEVPMHRYLYYFHIKNHDGVYRGEKPDLEERGPFVYREYRHRFNNSWSDDLTLISFRKYDYYIFDPELSCDECDPSMVITVPNIPMVGLYAGLQEKLGDNFWTRLAGSMATASEEMLVNVSVHNITFGYSDATLSALHKLSADLPTGFPGMNPNLSSEAEAPVGHTITHTGHGNISLIQYLYQWDGQRELSVWGSEECNRLYGSSDGTQFARNLKRFEPIETFVGNLFIVVKLLYEGDVELHGITLYRFGIDNSTYANASQVHDNAGKYLYGPPGVFNMTSAQGGIPIFLSKPHFLDADPSYVENLEGVEPDRAKHDTFVDVEPITGNTMRARQRLQLNVKINRVPVYGENIRETLVPVGWIDEGSALTPSLAKRFRNTVYLFRSIARIGGYVSLGTALLLAIICAVMFWKAKTAKDRRRFGDSYNNLDGSADQTGLQMDGEIETNYKTFEDAESAFAVKPSDRRKNRRTSSIRD